MDSATNPYGASAAEGAAQPEPFRVRGARAVVALLTGILGCLLVGGLIAYQELRAEPLKAEAVVQIARTPPTVLPSTRRPSADADEFERFRNTQSNVVLSDAVLSRALQRPGVHDLPMVRRQADAIDWLSEALVVTSPPNSEYMMVQLETGSDEEHEQAIQIVNAVVNEYVDYANSLERLRRGRQVDQLRTSNEALEKRLLELRKQHQELVKVTEDNVEVMSWAHKIENRQRFLDELHNELARCEVELNAPSRVWLVQEARAPEEE